MLALAVPSAQGEPRWSVSVKAGALLGLGGLELEHENSQNGLLIDVGFAEGRQTLLLLGRHYFAPQAGHRLFADLRAGTMRVTGGDNAEYVSLFAVGVGYEAPLIRFVRATVETGLGLQNIEPSFTPITRAGIFLGATLGLRF